MLTIDRIRAFAKENYNNGGDFVVECWSASDTQDFLARGGTLRELAKMFFEHREHFFSRILWRIFFQFDAGKQFSGKDRAQNYDTSEKIRTLAEKSS